MESRPDCRSSIIATLRILSSPEEQLAYERRVPNVRVPDELISRWFDDTYLPGSRVFAECFSLAELDAMREFDDFFDELIDRLPSADRGVAEWLVDENWQGIIRRAGLLLDDLRPADSPNR